MSAPHGPSRVVELYYTVGELEVLLRFSRSYLRKKLRAGTFPGAVNIDGDVRVPASAVNTWLAEHPLDLDPGTRARNESELRRRLKLDRSPDV